MQRFNDALKRRALVAALPTRDRRLRAPETLRELLLREPRATTAGNNKISTTHGHDYTESGIARN
jgi:hypothetical protein